MMNEIYNFENIELLENIQKKRRIVLLCINIPLFILLIVLFCLMNRSNYIYFAVIISIILFYLSAGMFFYLMTIYRRDRYEIKFLSHLKECNSKTNHIFGFTVKDEIISKYHKTFYVVEVATKNKDKECYIEENKLDLLNGKTINIVTIRDRILTEYSFGDRDED